MDCRKCKRYQRNQYLIVFRDGVQPMNYSLGLYEKAMPNSITLREKLTAAKAAGFDTMEISVDETDERQARLYWNRNQQLGLHHAMEDTGMHIGTLCLSGHRKWPLGSHDMQTRAHAVEIFRRAVDFACEFGIRIIQLAGYDVYYEQGDEKTRAWFCEGLRQGVDYAARYGVLCGFETMETPFMDTVSKAMTYVKEVNSPYLGVYPDLGNLTNACRIYETSVLDELECARGHLLSMHIKETEAGKYRDMRFGTGQVNFVQGIQKARELGVHCFVAECWDDGREDYLNAIREVNDFIRACFVKAEQI